MSNFVTSSGSESDDECSLDSNESSPYQLGFVDDTTLNDLFYDPNWSNWDGGKIGGKPIWLDPLNIPEPNDLTCQICQQPLAFLLQIYSPLDSNSSFHRCLYLFCCRKSTCFKQNSIICLRNQLPRENPWYPPSESPETSSSVPSLIEIQQQFDSLPTLCEICGCRAPHACSACHLSHYCSKAHQKLHWKEHKQTCKLRQQQKGQGLGLGLGGKSTSISSSSSISFSSSSSLTSSSSSSSSIPSEIQSLSQYRQYQHSSSSTPSPSSLFPEFSILVEEEDLSTSGLVLKAQEAMSKTHVWEDAEMKSEDIDHTLSSSSSSSTPTSISSSSPPPPLDDLSLTQRHYSQALGNEAPDPVYIQFLERIQRGGGVQGGEVQGVGGVGGGGEDQVLRYNRWPNIHHHHQNQNNNNNNNNNDSNDNDNHDDDNHDNDDDDGDDENETPTSSPSSTSTLSPSSAPSPPPLSPPLSLPLGPLIISSEEKQRQISHIQQQQQKLLLQQQQQGEGGETSTSSSSTPSSSSVPSPSLSLAPPCPICLAPRDFEFQVMPQLLFYLQVDSSTSLQGGAVAAAMQIQREREEEKEEEVQVRSRQGGEGGGGGNERLKEKEKQRENELKRIAKQAFSNDRDEDLDWGSIDVYTCTNSCCPGRSHSLEGGLLGEEEEGLVCCGYVREYVWVQAPFLPLTSNKI